MTTMEGLPTSYGVGIAVGPIVSESGDVDGLAIVANILERQKPNPKNRFGEDFDEEGWLCKKFSSGNKCGHDPVNPRLDLRIPAQLNIPTVLTKLLEKIKKYFVDTSFFPKLNAANNSERKQRSERREAALLCLGVIIKFTNILNLQCEIPSPVGMIGLTMRLLARHAGIGKSRIFRAVSDLKDAGIIEVLERSELKEQGYRGVAAIKKLSRSVFVQCGLVEELDRQAEYKQFKIDQAKEKAKAIEDKKLAEAAKKELKEMLQLSLLDKTCNRLGIRKTLAKPALKRTEHAPQEQKQMNAAARRAFNVRSMELRAEHPDWSWDEIRKQAESETLHL